MPGFGEQMRQISLAFVPTAILSREVGAIRGKSLILNLPGQPKAIKETTEGAKDAAGKPLVPGIFAAVPYCLDLIGGPYVETNESVIKAFRPKSAIRAAGRRRLATKPPRHDESREEFRAKRADQSPPHEEARREFATRASRPPQPAGCAKPAGPQRMGEAGLQFAFPAKHQRA